MEKKIDFETQIKRLEEIANKMEDKSTPLDESIALYEEAKKITNELELAIKTAKEKIEEIIEVK